MRKPMLPTKLPLKRGSYRRTLGAFGHWGHFQTLGLSAVQILGLHSMFISPSSGVWLFQNHFWSFTDYNFLRTEERWQASYVEGYQGGK